MPVWGYAILRFWTFVTQATIQLRINCQASIKMKNSWLDRFHLGSETMLTTIVIWLCTLPLVGLFVLPFFGTKGALLAAGMLFMIALLLCWGICSWRIYKDE